MSDRPFPLARTPDDGKRLSGERPWDESTRPAGPPPDPAREYSAEELATGQHLVDVHDALRAELSRLRGVVEEVGEGEADPAARC